MSIDWSFIKWVEPTPLLRGDEWRPFEPCIENVVQAFHELITEDIVAALTSERPLSRPDDKTDLFGRVVE